MKKNLHSNYYERENNNDKLNGFMFNHIRRDSNILFGEICDSIIYFISTELVFQKTI